MHPTLPKLQISTLEGKAKNLIGQCFVYFCHLTLCKNLWNYKLQRNQIIQLAAEESRKRSEFVSRYFLAILKVGCDSDVQNKLNRYWRQPCFLENNGCHRQF